MKRAWDVVDSVFLRNVRTDVLLQPDIKSVQWLHQRTSAGTQNQPSQALFIEKVRGSSPLAARYLYTDSSVDLRPNSGQQQSFSDLRQPAERGRCRQADRTDANVRLM